MCQKKKDSVDFPMYLYMNCDSLERSSRANGNKFDREDK